MTRRLVNFDRREAGPVLDGIVEWSWMVAWDLPAGTSHDQQVLNQPAGKISVGTIDDAGVALDPPEGRVYGVLLDGPAKSAADRQLTFDRGLPGLDEPTLMARISAINNNSDRVAELRAALESWSSVDRRP
ncbi:MAG: hypothetical protein AAGA65_23090 [Actinomycetota bacterium]